MALRSTVRHLPVIRRFLHEVCSGDAAPKINEEDVIRYVERHAQDWSPGTGSSDVLVVARLYPLPPPSGLNAAVR
ncbi:hypothetical protein [Bradyrhizobium sp. STM 3561]|uniref:hypothetical protein n=1 Tax=Bradyrhizobium sp. STM 3561 TaxID=578923 RepID=UPI00388E305D